MMQAGRAQILEPVEAKQTQRFAAVDTAPAHDQGTTTAPTPNVPTEAKPQVTGNQLADVPVASPVTAESPVVIIDDFPPPLVVAEPITPYLANTFADAFSDVADAFAAELTDTLPHADDEIAAEMIPDFAAAPVLPNAEPHPPMALLHEEARLPPAPRPAPLTKGHVTPAVATDAEPLPARAPRPPDILPMRDEPELPLAPRPAPLKSSVISSRRPRAEAFGDVSATSTEHPVGGFVPRLPLTTD